MVLGKSITQNEQLASLYSGLTCKASSCHSRQRAGWRRKTVGAISYIVPALCQQLNGDVSYLLIRWWWQHHVRESQPRQKQTIFFKSIGAQQSYILVLYKFCFNVRIYQIYIFLFNVQKMKTFTHVYNWIYDCHKYQPPLLFLIGRVVSHFPKLF